VRAAPAFTVNFEANATPSIVTMPLAIVATVLSPGTPLLQRLAWLQLPVPLKTLEAAVLGLTLPLRAMVGMACAPSSTSNESSQLSSVTSRRYPVEVHYRISSIKNPFVIRKFRVKIYKGYVFENIAVITNIKLSS